MPLLPTPARHVAQFSMKKIVRGSFQTGQLCVLLKGERGLKDRLLEDFFFPPHVSRC